MQLQAPLGMLLLGMTSVFVVLLNALWTMQVVHAQMRLPLHA